MSQTTDTTMIDASIKIVQASFAQAYGKRIKLITDMGGEPPSENNSYLYNAVLFQYEGRLTDESGDKYVFFIYQTGGEWKADFVKT